MQAAAHRTVILGALAALLAAGSAQALPEPSALPGNDAPLVTTSLLEPTSVLPAQDPGPDSGGNGSVLPSEPAPSAPSPPLPAPGEGTLGGLLGEEDPAPANQTGPGDDPPGGNSTAPNNGTAAPPSGGNKTGGPTKGAPPIGGRGSASVGGADAGVNAAVGEDGAASGPPRANASATGPPATARHLVPGVETFLVVAAVAIAVLVLIARRAA